MKKNQKSVTIPNEPKKMTNFSQKVDKFIEMVTGAFDSVFNASKLYVELLQENPDVDEIIISRCKGISLAMLKKFELIGTGKLLPETIWLDEFVSRRVNACPVEVQKQLVNSVIPVAYKAKWGGTLVEHKRLAEITRYDADIAIGPKGVRDLKEQSKILAEKSKQMRIKDVRYIIDGDNVTFYCRSTFSCSELEDILKALKTKTIETVSSSMKKNQILPKTSSKVPAVK